MSREKERQRDIDRVRHMQKRRYIWRETERDRVRYIATRETGRETDKYRDTLRERKRQSETERRAKRETDRDTE